MILFNLLIPLMGDSYDRIRENQAVEGLITRANVICQIERQIFKPDNDA